MVDDTNRDIIDKVDSVAAQLQTSKSTNRLNTIINVAHFIKEAFLKKGYLIIDVSAAKTIKKKLTVFNDPYSRDSLRNYQCYNDFVERLIKLHGAQCKFINTVLKTERQLIIRIDKQVLSHVDYILTIKNHLLTMNSTLQSPNKDRATGDRDIVNNGLHNNEIEYTCSFLASAAIFALITQPNFHQSLLRLKFEDVMFTPASINLRYKSSEVFSRYFLPFPASAYFQRYVLFHESLHRRNHGRNVIKPSFFINKDTSIKRGRISSLFAEWTRKVLLLNNVSVDKGLTPPQFYKAALAASLLSGRDTGSSGQSYPPFVLSVQSRKIPSYSLHDNYLNHLSPDYKNFIPRTQAMRTSAKSRKKLNTALHEAIKAISDIRMFLEKVPTRIRYRLDAAGKIVEILEVYKNKLNDNDFANLSLYAKWVSYMLREWTHLKINVINDYASMVPSLLYNLAGEKAFHLQPPNVRDKYLQITIQEYNNDSIRDHLNYFCNFIAMELGDKFQQPRWSSKELQKEDVPSPKSLVSFEDIYKAIDMCDSLLMRYVYRLRDIDLIAKETDNAIHKIAAYKQIIALAFFAGLRISEILKLRINHVSFDGGIILTIRRSKTRNGVRNIPLYLLMPINILKEFDKYVSYIRKLHPYVDTPLFARRNLVKEGEPVKRRRRKESREVDFFSSTAVRKDIQLIFHMLGYSEFVFHHLRHSFANWFLLRWFVAVNKKETIPSDVPFLKYELFKQNYLDNITLLALGANRQKQGQSVFSFGMAVLARLMGHGGPIVTLETYVHNTDWLFYLLSKANEPKFISLTSKHAADLLQVTYPTLPALFKGRGYKKVIPEDLLKYQRKYVAFNRTTY